MYLGLGRGLLWVGLSPLGLLSLGGRAGSSLFLSPVSFGGNFGSSRLTFPFCVGVVSEEELLSTLLDPLCGPLESEKGGSSSALGWVVL